MGSVLDPREEDRLPELPADAWGTIARAALHGEDDDVKAWARLSLVSRAWRTGLSSVPHTSL